MTATSVTSPGTAANNTSVGTVSWTTATPASQASGLPFGAVDVAGTGTVAWTVSTIAASDNNYTTAALAASELSHALYVWGYPFTIPTSATITGIKVEIEANQTGTGTINDNNVQLLKLFAPVGNNKASATQWNATTDVVRSYGGDGDLWGTTWTPGQINTNAFGVAISAQEFGGANPATARIDNVIITVYYTTLTGDVTTSNNAYLTAVLNNSASQYLAASNFGFAVPSNATIDGILVEVERYQSAGTTAADNSIRLLKRGVVTGTNHAVTGAWATSDANTYVSYGGSNDDWSVLWTPADINAADFGVVVSATASGSATAAIDHIRVTVYYTSGYDGTPQVQSNSEVVLFGQRWRINGRVQVGLATQQPARIVTDPNFEPNANPLVNTYVVDDLRGGMGLWAYRTYLGGVVDPQELMRYWSGENISGLFKGATGMGPLVTSIGYGTNAAAYAVNRIGNSLIGVFGTGAYTYSSGATWSASTHTFGTAPKDSVSFNSWVFYALGASGIAYQTDATTWVETAAGASDPAALSLVVWDNRIWALDTAGVLWYSSSGAAASWTHSTPAIPSSSLTNIDLVVWDDASGDQVITALTTDGVYQYDEITDKWMKGRFVVPNSYRQSDVRANGVVYRGALYFRSTRTKIYRLTQTGSGILVEDVSIGAPDGLMTASPNLNGDIWSMAADNDYLYAGMGQATTAGPLIAIFAYSQPPRLNDNPQTGAGWHPIYVGLATQSSSTFNGIRTLRTVDTRTSTAGAISLYFDDMLSTTIHGMSYLTPPTANPLTPAGGGSYATTGYVELPIYHAGRPEQVKTARCVCLKLVNGSVNETVTVAYRLNGSTGNYTTLGSAVTSSNDTTIYFGTNNIGVDFRSIQFKLSFARGGTTTLAPILEYFKMDFAWNPEVARLFSVDIDVSDDYMGRTAQQQVDTLWTMMKATAFGTFAWRDDSGNVQSYLVKLAKLQGTEETGWDFRSSYRLTLVEMAAN